MVTSDRDPVRTRERILRAARREFVAKGFAGARVDAIARSATVNKRMLYHYFGDKEALYRAVLRGGIAINLDLVAAAPADPDDLLPFLFTRVLQRVDGIRLLQWEALGRRIAELRADRAPCRFDRDVHDPYRSARLLSRCALGPAGRQPAGRVGRAVGHHVARADRPRLVLDSAVRHDLQRGDPHRPGQRRRACA